MVDNQLIGIKEAWIGKPSPSNENPTHATAKSDAAYTSAPVTALELGG